MKIKIPRCILTFTIVISLLFLSSCTLLTSESNVLVVTENDPWFDECKVVFDADLIGSVEETLPIFADDAYIIYNNYYDEDYNHVTNILCASISTGDVCAIDYSECFANGLSVDLGCCYKDNDNYYLSFMVSNNSSVENYIGRIDFSSQSVVDIELISFDCDSDVWVNKIISKNGDLFIEFMFLDNYIYKYGFKHLDSNHNSVSEVFIEDQINMWTLDETNNYVYFAYNSNAGIENSVCRVNENGVKTVISISVDLIEKASYGIISDDGFVFMVNNDLTITSLNMTSLEEVLVFDYNQCNANIAELFAGSPIYINESTILFMSCAVNSKGENVYNVISTLQTCGTNPNVGKKIMHIAPYTMLSNSEAMALQSFNGESTDTIIYITMEYSLLNKEEILLKHSIGEMDSYLETELLIVDILEQDILAGTGPDIITGFGEYASLDDSHYLIDLNRYIDGENGINREDYFNNLFEAFETEGCLYQIPIDACVMGIYVNETNLYYGQTGFTFDEYKSFVENNCHGIDPMQVSLEQLGTLRMLLMMNYDGLYVSNYEIDLDNETFRTIAEYANSLSNSYGESLTPECARFALFSDFYADLSSSNLDEYYRLLGFPSIEGGGPMAKMLYSTAITVSSNSPDDAWGFLRLLLSEEFQMNMEGNPININAFNVYTHSSIEQVNALIEETTGLSNYYSEEIADCYYAYFANVTVGGKIDSVTMVIMNEEMCAYFESQKTLDEVIPVLESRINNMLAEREP